MNNKETALNNFMQILLDIDVLNQRTVDKVFNNQYISCNEKELLKEKNPLTILLMWNYLFRKDMDYFYNVELKNSIDYCKKTLSKINPTEKNTELFSKLESIYSNYKNKYMLANNKKIYFDINNEEFVYEILKDSLVIWNDYKVLGIRIKYIIDNTNLDYNRKPFSINQFKNIADSISINFPNNTTHSRILAKTKSYRDLLVDKFE